MVERSSLQITVVALTSSHKQTASAVGSQFDTAPRVVAESLLPAGNV